MSLGIVLLAAGQSKRMGKSKALLAWQNQTVLDAVCSALVKGIRSEKVNKWVYKSKIDKPVLCAVIKKERVNQEDDIAIARVVKKYGFTTLFNENVLLGQAHSTALGASFMKSQMFIEGVLYSVCDQPMLAPSVIEGLIEKFYEAFSIYGSKAIVRPLYGKEKTPGNPIIFGTYWLPVLANLKGDQGGRSILEAEGKKYLVSLPILFHYGQDIDSPEDYERLYSLYGTNTKKGNL